MILGWRIVRLNVMKSASQFVIVLVTAPTKALAQTLAHAALEQKLIACANIVPRVESHYWWKGNIEASSEALLILKSRRPLLSKLESVIRTLHPYDTPEFVALSLTAGSKRYLDWLQEETGAPRPRHRRRV